MIKDKDNFSYSDKMLYSHMISHVYVIMYVQTGIMWKIYLRMSILFEK